MSTLTKRCFEYRAPPRHNKFWTVQVAGSTAFVTYGKIGSAGATQVKQFASPARADEFAAKMIREKRDKGYVEVGGTAYPGAPASQVAAAAGGPVPAARPAGSGGGGPTAGDRFIDI